MEGIIIGFDPFLNLVIEKGIEVVKRADQVSFSQILLIFLKRLWIGKLQCELFYPEREEGDWNGGDPGQKCGVSCGAGASQVIFPSTIWDCKQCL